MAPSGKKLEAALRDAVHEVAKTDRASLTVNHIRKIVEETQDLEEGFFVTGDWKAKSKTVIKETAVSLPLSVAYTSFTLARTHTTRAPTKCFARAREALSC